MAEDWVTKVNGIDDEAEALRSAIALSLGRDPEPKGSTDNSPAIDLTDDNDTPEAYLTSSHPPSFHERAARQRTSVEPITTNSLTLLGLDRKKMEEERIERLRKRKAQESPDPQRRPPAQRVRVEPSRPSPSTTPRFLRGAVKKTWAMGFPRSGDDITIEEVFQKDQLELAVLSSFQWDEKWLLSKVNLATTKLVLVAFATDEAQVCIHQKRRGS